MSKSKREKLRAKQQRKALKTRLIWSGLGAIVLAALGLLVFLGVRPAMGDEVAIPANFGEHLEEGVDPGPFPSNPPAGGRHYASELDAGFYEENSSQTQIAYPEGYIGHNLEHGYVVFWYNCASLSESECGTLKTEIRAVMDDFGGTKLIAFPWPSLDGSVAMTSWGRIQRFDSFDPNTAAAFIKANLNKAPEPNAP